MRNPVAYNNSKIVLSLLPLKVVQSGASSNLSISFSLKFIGSLRPTFGDSINSEGLI